ncbi:unnamed protein product [Somion occarium]|uniref:Amine oxidase domain-containing protein n=1 Tax=Somion occarium TaxID=3059160 RepID=A0ABP1DPB4_9APHY
MSQTPLRVGIVGAGVAGLYSAMLLRKHGHIVHIFEASNRVGGRIYTHRFNTQEDQYFEAGAMRLPDSSFQKIVYDLIDHLNTSPSLPEHMRIKRIPYILNSPGNFVHINGRRYTNDTLSTASAAVMTPRALDWEVPAEYLDKSAGDLLNAALEPLVKELRVDFEQGFQSLLRFDHMSFRFYLQVEVGWPAKVIDFVETVTSQTNQFTLSVTELVMQHMDFGTKEWYTIERGMDRLPEAMAHVVGLDNITFGARVSGIRSVNGVVHIVAKGYDQNIEADFDKVLLAVPPAALKMISDRPRWGIEKEMAIRSLHFEPLYKMGMLFRTRFWEKHTRGGQSTTDLPIRWIVYPSNGIGSEGPGALLLYAWMTDAETWLPLQLHERRSLAVHCLQQLYPDVNIASQLLETFDVAWSAKSSTGDAMFLPGQFTARFDIAHQPESASGAGTPNVFFAGEHLSKHHTWIAGALESALYAVRQIVQHEVQALEPVVADHFTIVPDVVSLAKLPVAFSDMLSIGDRSDSLNGITHANFAVDIVNDEASGTVQVLS